MFIAQQIQLFYTYVQPIISKQAHIEEICQSNESCNELTGWFHSMVDPHIAYVYAAQSHYFVHILLDRCGSPCVVLTTCCLAMYSR